MTNNKELLDEVSECQYSIKLADNNKLSIKHNGNLITKIGERKIEIKNILCSNEVRNNLLALLDILKNDLITIMYEDLYTKNLFNLIIMDKRDYKIIYKLQTDDFKILFIINLPILRNKNKEINAILEKNFKNQIEEKLIEKLIHLRFGHISSKLINPIKENIDLEKCKECIMSKMTRDTFPENKKRQDKPFSLIHADLIGPFNQESRNGNLENDIKQIDIDLNINNENKNIDDNNDSMDNNNNDVEIENNENFSSSSDDNENEKIIVRKKRKFGNINNIQKLNNIDLDILNIIEDSSNDDNLYLNKLFNIDEYDYVDSKGFEYFVENMLINHLEINKKPPKNIKEALSGNEKENWKNSCLDEINSMIENEIYEVIDNPHNNVKV